MQISIEDQGTGIPAEYLAKIFDPFFTTKHEGSGLGLATSYSIVKKHGGCIEVDSLLGKGTSFRIFLPACVDGQAATRCDDENVVQGRGRILIMDDERLVLDMVCDMLRGLGYEPSGANTGEKAVDMYRAARDDGRPFDVVILDLTVVGGMGGRDTIKLLRDIDPDVVALVSSGYADDPVMADCQAYGFAGVVTKPYRIADIARALSRVQNAGDG